MRSFVYFALTSATIMISASPIKRDQFSCFPMFSSECKQNETAYLASVCWPETYATGPQNAPCNYIQDIVITCIYGGGDYEAQRLCVCGSRFWENMRECARCNMEHSPELWQPRVSFEGLTHSISSEYCAVSVVPTALFWPDAMYKYYAASAAILDQRTSSETEKATFTDPLGSNTAVSLYATSFVTGSAGTAATLQTQSGSTTFYVSSGQIVASPTTTQQNPGGTIASILANPPTTSPSTSRSTAMHTSKKSSQSSSRSKRETTTTASISSTTSETASIGGNALSILSAAEATFSDSASVTSTSTTSMSAST